MINHWLNEEKRVNSKYSQFKVFDLTEKRNNNDHELIKYISEQLFINLGYPDKIKRIFENESIEKLQKHVNDEYLPK